MSDFDMEAEVRRLGIALCIQDPRISWIQQPESLGLLLSFGRRARKAGQNDIKDKLLRKEGVN